MLFLTKWSSYQFQAVLAKTEFKENFDMTNTIKIRGQRLLRLRSKTGTLLFTMLILILWSELSKKWSVELVKVFYFTTHDPNTVKIPSAKKSRMLYKAQCKKLKTIYSTQYKKLQYGCKIRQKKTTTENTLLKEITIHEYNSAEQWKKTRFES